MAHNRTTDFSPAFKHETLMKLPQYVASPDFPNLYEWDSSNVNDMLVVEGTVARLEPVNCTIVGTISSDRQHLKPQGNFNPRFAKSDGAAKAKLQLFLTEPVHVDYFADDFRAGLDALRAAQDSIATTEKKEHFILPSNRIALNFPLFTPKTKSLDQDPVVVERTKNYQVHDNDCAEYFDKQKNTHHICELDVFGRDELRISVDDFEDKLTAGTLVEVSFNLFHYAVGPLGAATSDTFTARMTSVSILQEAPERTANNKTPTRRPNQSAQSPVKTHRSEQAKAAASFVPPKSSGASAHTPQASTSSGKQGSKQKEKRDRSDDEHTADDDDGGSPKKKARGSGQTKNV